MTLKTSVSLLVCAGLIAFAGCSSHSGDDQSTSPGPLDIALQTIVEENALTPLAAPESPPQALVDLGEALFFDPELSGNRDMSCATCHFPTEGLGDGLPVSFGTGAVGLADERKLANGPLIPRNAPELFNRGDASLRTMFWDSRVAQNADGSFMSPAASLLPGGLDSVLAVQALFPVTSREEMRGQVGDTDVRGNVNELASVDDTDFAAMWGLLLKRLEAVPEYRRLFAEAYPDVPRDAWGPEHIANAIAAYEADQFTFTGAPWDRYLAGEIDALTDEQKRGAQLFYGEARCSACHTGTIMSDQQHHNVGVPQIGPGKGEEAPADRGRQRVSGNPKDAFAFRTTPLRNVTVTGPYMHDGAYETLEDAVRHMLNPRASLLAYDASRLPADLRPGALSKKQKTAILANLSPVVQDGVTLTDDQFNELMAFLGSLTDPEAEDLTEDVPDAVPSGLPVGGGSAP